eukprot:Skav228254  [mRNA]  locus=scaffold3112:264241:268087:+ [translate_table: standard]
MFHACAHIGEAAVPFWELLPGRPAEESFYQRMQQRIESLSAAMGSETGASMGSTTNSNRRGTECNMDGAPCEPTALTAHLQQQKVEAVDAQETGLEKRYVVSCGVKQGGNDVRLHGRWMELSTNKVESDSVWRTGTRKTKRMSNKQQSQLWERESLFTRLCPVIQPAGRFRLSWDAAGLFLILLDAFILPVTLAWDLRSSFETVGGAIQSLAFWISVIFWTTDVVFNFSTGFYKSGKLISHRGQIISHYIKTWLFFDLILLSIDFLHAFTEMGELAALRYARMVRAFRLLRLLKMSKLQDILQEVAASTGQQWIMLVIAIVNTAFMILIVAHILTCMWFWLGRAAEDDGIVSWIQRSGGPDYRTELSIYVQYLHSLRYIMNAPSPPDISPESARERLFDIFSYVFTLAVIGSAISAIAGTLQELKAMNEASARQRREIRIYLTSQNASFELVSRIMKFVDYKLAKMSFVTFEPGLISTTLQTELFVGQRSRFLERLPIFLLTSDLFPDVFATICAALNKNVYEQKEYIFVAGAWSTALYITAAGTFVYGDERNRSDELEGEHWFGELSLYSEQTIHSSTLSARTFAEVFALTGADLADCVRDSPGCTSMFCEYAKDFVSSMQRASLTTSVEEQAQISDKCCKQNQFYQVLYPDPSKLFHNIAVAKRVKASWIRHLKSQNQTISMGVSDASKKPQEEDSEEYHLDDSDSISVNTEDTDLEDPGLREMLAKVAGGEFGQSLAKDLESSVPELHSQLGSHMVFEQAAERDRAISSCISILALVHDRYDVFTEPQAAPVKLRPEQWQVLRRIVSMISPNEEQMQAVIVLLSIRGLGKCKTVLSQVPSDMKRPERAVIHLMTAEPQVVPSVSWLTETQRESITNALQVHETFNLAQMLQGENVPANVAELFQLVHQQDQEGSDGFHFYMLFLLGFMSGIAAGNGSRFMNAKNAEAAISGFLMLQSLLKSPARDIYWGYMTTRARALKIPFETAEDLVLVRLACLSRLQDASQYGALRGSWDVLGTFQKTVLTNHFLADGIQTRAFLLEFLPNCVANAKSNGLQLVLVELLTNLKQAVQASKETKEVMLLPVDLMDMSEFIAAERTGAEPTTQTATLPVLPTKSREFWQAAVLLVRDTGTGGQEHLRAEGNQ